MQKFKFLFLICIFIFSENTLFAQPDLSGTIKIRKPKDLLPKIAGKNGGEITPSQFCVSDGIYVTTEGIKILNFEITYPKSTGEYTMLVDGNKIPDNLCTDIAKLRKGDQINIEKILAEDDLGRKFTLTAMRFDIIPDSLGAPVLVTKTVVNPANNNRGKEIGMYQLKLSYVPMQKTYIKLGPDSTAFFVISPGEPVVLNQVLMTNYSRTNLYHGTYSIQGDSIKIDFNPGYSDFDYIGRMEPGGLLLMPHDHEGNPINLVDGGVQRFAVLPFSKQ